MSGQEHGEYISDGVTRALIEAHMELGGTPTLPALVYCAACAFGNIGIAVGDDAEEYAARQPPLSDEEWW